jgi:enhancing lycopene biosynthesis protein 2
MAVQAGINSTTANDLINAEMIGVPFVIEGPRAIPIYESLAMQIDNSKLTSNVCTIPSWDAAPATEVTAETDEVVSVNYTTSKKSITGTMVSTRALVSDQFTMDSGQLGSGSVDEMAANVRDRIDVITLALFGTASNISDNTGVNLTTALFAAALALFKAQKPGGIMCFLGSPAQLRDINTDLANNAGGAQINGAGLALFTNGMTDGYIAQYRGVAIFESSNVAAADGANDVGGFLSIIAGQPGAAPTRSGLALGVWHGIKAEGLRAPHRFGLDVTVAARVGVGRSNERMIRGVISKRAA